MNAQTKESQDQLTPQSAIELLKEGNKRFVNNKITDRDLLLQVNQTSGGQFPRVDWSSAGCSDCCSRCSNWLESL